MKLRIFFLFLIFTSIFLSCKKDEPLVTGKSSVPMLNKIIVDNQTNNEYLYNDLNLIREEKTRFDFTIHHYNAKNQLVTSDYYVENDILSIDVQNIGTILTKNRIVNPDQAKIVGTATYEYNSNDELVKTTFNRPSETTSEYSLFSYNGNKKINRKTLYWENSVTGYIEYSYDSNGNLIKESLYYLPSTGVAELISTTQYEFDTKQNPFKSFNSLMIPGINTNRNNIVKEIYTIYPSIEKGTEKVQITQTTYVYDGLGYPVLKNGNIIYYYL
jgi:hypothetical protein